MKKTAVVIILLISTSLYAAEAGLAQPKPVSGTAAITMNLPGAISAAKNSIGISGFSFRFLDADKKGFQIPFNFQFSNSDSVSAAGSSNSMSFSLSSGYYFVNPMIVNQFIRVNILSGFYAGYSGSWANINRTGPGPLGKLKSAVDSTNSFSLGISGSLEAEVPIGRLFSIPADTICLTGGISVAVSGTFKANYTGVRYYSGNLSFAFGTSASGTNFNSLGLRYYF